MKKEIFRGFGSKISKMGKKYFVEYDSGGIARETNEIEITEQEMIKFQISENDAYEVLSNAQKRHERNQKKPCKWFK